MSSSGRRAGSPDTRSEILAAARRVFAVSGYDKASVRQIAGEAGVDPSLLYHYFDTKDQLFAQSMNLPVVPVEMIAGIERESLGRSLAETFFSIWEVEQAREAFLGVLRSAIAGEEQSVAAFREFIVDNLQRAVSSVIDADDADLRALLMASHLVGVAIARYVVRLEPLASAPVEDIVDLVAPRIQGYVSPDRP